MTAEIHTDGRRRVVIEGVRPEIDDGRFAIKRIVGERVVVECDAFCDGHDMIGVVLRYRREGAAHWQEQPMVPLVNDRWRGAFEVTELGRYEYTLVAWLDHFKSWRHEFQRRNEPQDIELALRIGADLVAVAIERAGNADAEKLRSWAEALRGGADLATRRTRALDEELAVLMARHPDRRWASDYDRVLAVVVDEPRARFSTWYELFPRSCGPGLKHGTFRDAEQWLPRICDMGFDVVYLPPVHPIGRVNRKGKNNTLAPAPDDVGVPWAIGSDEGGHKAIHPQLGTLEDFRRFVRRASELGLEVALDIAFQAAPDHPWVKEHPEWFRWRPDGTVQYAENPPKKYQDIYPLNFESDDWQELWDELTEVFLYWCGQGVHIFRVDNPHTKAFRFWDYTIARVKAQYPEAIFLSEAFTRPKVMHRLAKGGFTQSYTYFTWRNTKWELMEYMHELTRTDGREYFRPNFWPNTPDILPQYLQFGGRPAFLIRLVVAATMTANYGIYGPAYEVHDNTPLAPGKEEYLNSEKYEIKDWDLDRPDALGLFIGRINGIRHHNPALQSDWSLRFHRIENDEILCYSKATEDLSNVILVVVSLDYTHRQSGWVDLDLKALGIDPEHPYQVHDLITDERYMWHGPRNYVELDPHRVAAHVFRVRSNIRTEQDFETYHL
jgi:starch synthase (maltosyl-transferring)